ncbi:MAG: hypothetical protein Q4B65_01690 [Candidatus Saccharibacteria bacterium]|nr:hypothetical protein [Candidatus Saccharibacteria bacterium]
MNDYLVDRETLGQFVDALIAQKYQNQPDANLETIRENAIRKLDDKISLAIFGSLSKEKLAEVNILLDSEDDDPAIFQNFFEQAGINVQQVITNTLKTYKMEFLGGENA